MSAHPTACIITMIFQLQREHCKSKQLFTIDKSQLTIIFLIPRKKRNDERLTMKGERLTRDEKIISQHDGTDKTDSCIATLACSLWRTARQREMSIGIQQRKCKHFSVFIR